MDTNGGFIYTAGQPEVAEHAASSYSAEATPVPGRLTAAQLTRLTSWLDTALLELTRNQRRRHQRHSPLYTLSAYLDEAIKVLGVLASMSSAVPQGAIKVAYLLRLTAELAEGCAGYDVRRYQVSSDEAADEEQQKAPRTTRALSHTLRLFHLVDAQWSALLRSRTLDWPFAKREAVRLFPADAEPSNDNASAPTTDGGGRHAASSSAHATAQEEPASGQTSHRTLSQTDRVRLRNVALRSRATLRDWAHRQLDEQWQTDMYDERAQEESELRACETGEERMAEGDLESDRDEMDGIVERVDEVDEVELTSVEIERLEQERQAEAQGVQLEEDEEEEEMEEVVGPSHAAPDEAQQRGSALQHELPQREEEVDGTEEGKHFADLFNKHLDPDASDAEEEEDQSQVGSTSDRPHKRQASRSPSATRQAKSAKATQDQDDAPPPPTAAAEEGVLVWDAAFARVLSQTLRSLSDRADAQAEREARDKRKRGGGANEESEDVRGREKSVDDD